MTKLNKVILKPWGNYKNIFIGKNFIVKILTIKSRCKISYSIITKGQNTGWSQKELRL